MYRLMVSGGGSFHPLPSPCCRIVCEKYRQVLFIWIFGLVSKILFANLKKKIQASSFPRKLSRDLFSTLGKWKFKIFEVFRAYLRWFSIFFHEIFTVARSYRLLATSIKSLLIRTLVSLETRLKVPILAIIWRFLAFFKLSVLA